MKAAEVGFAGTVLAVAMVYEALALAMPRGNLAFPGPGFFPAMVGGFLLLSAAGCLVQALVRPSAARAESGQAPAAARQVHRTALLLGLLAAYGLLLPGLGFPLAISLFVLAAMRVFGYRRWLAAILVAAGVAAVSYVVFVVWLKVPLPMGLLGVLLE
jgi:putative tricarboxylic transport membrane protein